MDLVLLFTLSLCCWTAAGRAVWDDKPGLIISNDEIDDGESVRVSCTLPIDYRGGDCRLYREHAHKPFKVMTATDYICVFQLTSQELLGSQLVGSQVYLRCDYHLQQYTSVSSDIRGITVWGSSPSPGLSVSHRFVSPEDTVEVTCSPPLRSVSHCQFYRDQILVSHGLCNRSLTGQQLAFWSKPALLLPVNLTCRYYPDRRHHIRSEPSTHNLLFVVDVSEATQPVDCKVSVDDDQMAAIKDDSWKFGGDEQPGVKVQVTNSQLMINETCDYIQSQIQSQASLDLIQPETT